MPAPDVIFGASLARWWRASDLSAVGIGNQIASWTDAASGVVAEQTIAQKRPTLQERTANGKTYLVAYFDGIDDGLQTSETTRYVQPNTVIAIVKTDAVATNQRIADSMQPSYRNLMDLVSSKWRMYSSAAVSTAENATTNWTIVVAVFNGASSTIRSNGGTATTGNVGTTDNQGTSIGIDYGGSQLPFKGDMVEIIRVAGAATAQQIVEVDSYAQDTYGITVADYSGGTPAATPFVGWGVPL